MSRKFPNLGNRVRLNSITPSSSTAPSNNNTVSIKDPETAIVKDIHTIQVDHETFSRLKDASDIMGECPTYSEVLDTILSHYLKWDKVERTYHYTPPVYTSLS